MPRAINSRATPPYRSTRSDWRYGACGPPMSGPSSHISPSQRRSSSTIVSDSAVDRAWSVSSTRMMNVPPWCFANSQLKIAVRAPPTWRCPVGDGAKRTRTVIGLEFIGSSLARSEEHTSELQSLAYLVCRLLLEKKKHPTLQARRAPRHIAQHTHLLPHRLLRSTTLHSHALPPLHLPNSLSSPASANSLRTHHVP